MPAFGADTSVLIAALCSWHERHEWALAALGDRLEAGGRLLIAAHGLVECYSVLTRLPPPHRIAPSVAAELLERNFARRTRVVGLSIRDCWDLVRTAPGRGVAGGRTYDAVIARSVARGGVSEFLTLNPSHFEGLFDEEIEVVSP